MDHVLVCPLYLTSRLYDHKGSTCYSLNNYMSPFALCEHNDIDLIQQITSSRRKKIQAVSSLNVKKKKKNLENGSITKVLYFTISIWPYCHISFTPNILDHPF